VQPAVAASVHLVAHCERDASGARRVVEIVAPTGVADGAITAHTLYRAVAA
jgi:pilus assembly protein CpaF